MFLKKQNLKNKIALVTGAGKGIGKACAIALAEAGASLVIVSRTKKDLDQVSKIVARHVHCSTVKVTSRCFVTLLHNIPFTNQSWLPQTVLLHSSFHAHAVASKCPPQLPGGSPL